MWFERPIPRTLGIWAVAIAGLLARPSAAEEQYLKFVHGLETRGFNDMAVQYLEQVRQEPKLPDDVKAVLDFELGRALRSTAEAAASPQAQEEILKKSATYLGKFLEDHPDRPEATQARAVLADVGLLRGKLTITLANAAAGARKAELMKQARATLERARGEARAAVESLGAAVRKLPARPRGRVESDRKAEVENTYMDAQLTFGLIDYALTQTLDPKDPTRTAMLQKASAAFDRIFQRYRDPMRIVALYAHLYDGKAHEEMGDLQTAMDIYDEVQANEPPRQDIQARKTLAPLLRTIEYFRLIILNKQKKYAAVIRDVEGFHEGRANQDPGWLRSNPHERHTAEGLGVQLELAKAYIAIGAKLPPGDNRREAFRRALRSLADVTKFRSPFQDEGFQLTRQYRKELTGKETTGPTSLDEAVALADTAIRAKDWPEAIKQLEAGLALSGDEKDPERVDEVQYKLAYVYYRAGQFAQAAESATKLARAARTTKAGRLAALLAMSAQAKAYAASSDKPAELDKLLALCQFIIKTWPQDPMAEEARMTASEIYRSRGAFDRAVQMLLTISPDSPRYPDARFRAGVAEWRAAAAEIRKPEAQRDRKAADAELHQAQALLEQSLKLQETGGAATPLTRLLVNTRLTLSELLLDTNHADQALALLQPLEDRAAQAPRSRAFDSQLLLRLHIATLRGYVAADQLDKAQTIMDRIEKEGGSGSAQVTRIYVQLGRQLEQQLHSLEASGQSDAAQKTRDSFVSFLNRLAGRPQQTVASMRFIAEAYFGLGMDDKAEQAFQQTLTLAASDPAYQTPQGRRALIPVRVKLATAEQRQGNFGPALQTIEEVLHDNPRLIEPKMVAGTILQAWGATAPENYRKAAAWWSQVANTLARDPKKPIEYFEARLHLAECLVKMGQSDEALRVLRQTAALHPTLGGPEMKAKFETLMSSVGVSAQAG